MRIKKIIINEYVFSIITRFAIIAFSFFKSVLVARFLGAELKGVTSYIYSIASVGYLVASFGMHLSYPFFKKKYGKVLREFTSAIALVFVGYIVVAFLFGICRVFSAELSTAIVLIPIMGYAAVLGYVYLIESPNDANRCEVIVAIIEFVATLIIMFFGKKSFISAIFVLFWGYVIRAIIYSIRLNVKLKVTPEIIRLIRELFKIGFVPMVSVLMTRLNYNVDIMMLKLYPNVSYSGIGIYSIGISFAEYILLLPDTFSGVLASKLSKGANEHEVVKVSKCSFWLSCILCLVLCGLCAWVIPFLYGQEYAGSYEVLILCAMGTVFVTFFKLVSQYNIVNGKQIINVILFSITIVANIIGNIILIPICGINGAAIASGFSNFVCGLTFSAWFTKQTGEKFSDLFMIRKSEIIILKERINRLIKIEKR